MGTFINGLGRKSNLDKWASYAKKNSYGDNAKQCKEQLAPAGRGDREDDWIPNNKDWQEDQHHKGWVDMKPTTADNTYTGKGGSKRD